MESCPFCESKFQDATIKEYEYWSLQVFVDDQHYIGRSVVVLKRHLVDLVGLSVKERNEFFDTVLPDLTTCLNQTFSPDLLNYAQLGNDCEHLHIHCVPRYKEPVLFEGEEFVDEYWGETYQQGYERVVFSHEKLMTLKNLLADHLPSSHPIGK